MAGYEKVRKEEVVYSTVKTEFAFFVADWHMLFFFFNMLFCLLVYPISTYIFELDF